MSQNIVKTKEFGRRNSLRTVTIEKNGKIQKFTIRPWLATMCITFIGALSIGYLGATGYLLFRDELIGATIAHQSRLQDEYEARISKLRTELDRVTSRNLYDQQLVENKIDKLLQQQKNIDLQQQNIIAVTQRAIIFDIDPPKLVPVPRLRPGATSNNSNNKDTLITGSIAPLGNEQTQFAKSLIPVLTPIAQNLQTLQNQQFDAIEQMLAQVHEKHGFYAKKLQKLGVKTPALAQLDENTGGPFVPIENSIEFGTYLELLHSSLDTLRETKKKISLVPVRNPLPGHEISSGYGSRIDPFRRRLAMHAGIDFKANTGTPVRATAAGKVTYASRKGGYGRLVEVKHASGHITRYAHLSRISVKVGDKISANSIVGKVGSTGRSTGPHLHYEIRRGDKAINPMNLLKAGQEFGL